MADLRAHSSTSNIFRLCLKNSSTGQPLTGLDHTSTGLIISTIADNEATATVYSVASSNVETITTLGTFAAPTSGKCRFKAVDGTNHPGLYEIHIADARFSVASAKKLVLSISGATNLLATDYEVELTRMNLQDGVRGGMTALPNAAAGASGGLWILGSMAGSPAITGSFSILNASGNAMSLISAGSNGSGLSLTGNGTAAGLTSEGGATGAGGLFKGGGTSGHGLRLFAQAGNSYGALIEGAGSGAAHGISIVAAGTGVDISLTDPLPANVTQWNSSAIATPDAAGYPKVTIKTGTGTGEVSMTSGVVNANAAQISGDSVAADRLETMLDGTGGNTLSLGSLLVSGVTTFTGAVTANGSVAINGGMSVINLGGTGLAVIGTSLGMSISGATGDGLNIDGATGCRGVWIEGGAFGLKIDPVDADGVGFWVDGGLDGGAAIELSGHGTGQALLLSQFDPPPGNLYRPGEGAIVGNVTGNISGSVGSVSNIAAQTGDSYARLGAPNGASVSADVAAVKSDTTSIGNRIGAFAGTGVNTILGFLRAMANKAAGIATPSELSSGGTYSNTTDALEAQADTGGSLTAEQQAQLDAIETATALITAGGVTVTSPLSTGGDLLTLVRGDTYNVASGQPITFTAAAGVWPDLTGATAKTFTIRDSSDASVLSVTPEITASGAGTQSVRVDLTSAQTAALVPGDPPGEQDHTFDLQVTLSDGTTKVTLRLGAVAVMKDVTRT